MLKRLSELRKDELVNGSIILFFTLLLFNFLNYVFQISMAKMLGPADFGIMASLMSIIYIFGIFAESVQTVSSKYTSRFNAKKEDGQIKDLLIRFSKKGFLFATLFFIFFVILSFPLSNFLRINFWLLFLTGIYLFYVFLTPVTRGVLQGKKKFMPLGMSLVFESLIKVFLSIFLVLLGAKVYGAIGGVLIASIISFFIIFIMLKDILAKKRKLADLHGGYLEGLPVLIAISAISLVYSLDTLLARAFFSPEIAGQYAFVSLIGKVIIFVSLSIGKAMLPISSEEFEKGNATKEIFKKSLLLVLSMSLVMTLIYSLFPKFIIKIVSLWSEQYLPGAEILYILALAYTFLSLTYVIILYKLSVNRLRGYSYGLLIFVILEIILLSKFSLGLIEFAWAFFFVNIAMFLYSVWLIKK